MGASHPPALKRFGQNFLIDHNIARKMIGLAAIQPDETVLEIGPGRGILTRGLCAKARTVIAIEIDRELARLLGRSPTESALSPGQVMESHVPSLAAQCPNLDLRIGDALEFSYEALPPGTVVVANLPYYVSTPLLFKLLESYSRIDRMVLMLQTEVALRLVAVPDTKAYGVLSVLTQYAADMTLAFRVSPNCFRPRPTVGSAVIVMRIKSRRPLDPPAKLTSSSWYAPHSLTGGKHSSTRFATRAMRRSRCRLLWLGAASHRCCGRKTCRWKTISRCSRHSTRARRNRISSAEF